MRKFFLIIFCIVLPGLASGRSSTDFRAIMPQNWTLSSLDHHGSRFDSPDGKSWLSLYRMPAANEPASAHMNAVRAVKDGRITYERQERTWIVVSGFKGDRIFYRKAMLACGKTEWHHLEFEYPASEKLAFDRMVTRASYALAAYENSGCHRAAR